MHHSNTHRSTQTARQDVPSDTSQLGRDAAIHGAWCLLSVCVTNYHPALACVLNRHGLQHFCSLLRATAFHQELALAIYSPNTHTYTHINKHTTQERMFDIARPDRDASRATTSYFGSEGGGTSSFASHMQAAPSSFDSHMQAPSSFVWVQPPRFSLLNRPSRVPPPPLFSSPPQPPTPSNASQLRGGGTVSSARIKARMAASKVAASEVRQCSCLCVSVLFIVKRVPRALHAHTPR